MKTLLLLFLNVFTLSTAMSQTFKRVEELAKMAHVQNTNGVAVADYDQDGDLDVFFTGLNQFDPNDETTWNRLLENKGDGTFEDVTIEAGFSIQFYNDGLRAERGEKMGVAWGDYDNDGFPDLFLANSREDQLYHNEGDGTFVDVTEQAGVAGCQVCYSASGTWWDHDRDGDLDLYVSILNGANIFYENKGDGTFENITEREEMEGQLSITWSSVALDVGKDGFLDLLNVNDTQYNEFFENRSGQRYNEASRANRLDDDGAGMGVTIGDYNNDGFFDIYITNIYNHQPNPLFTNSGNRRFTEDAEAMGVWDTGWGWGTHFLDFDHDGDEDLAAVNGPIDKLHQEVQPNINNILFKNTLKEGTLGFVDASTELEGSSNAKSKGFEVFDYDQDGDLDMVVANMDAPAYFYQSQTIDESKITELDENWLQIKLEGTTSNRDALGTTVEVKIGGQSYYRYHHGAAVFGQSLKPVHFGLGTGTMIDEIRFTWLTGITEAIYNIPANQILEFKEGAGTVVEEETTENPSNGGGVIVERHYNFPNPFRNATTISFDLAIIGNLNLKIYSVLGKLIFEADALVENIGTLDIEMDAKNLPAGVYYYQAEIGDKVMRGNMVKE